MEGELQAHREAKNKLLELAAIRRIRLRQRSRLTWIHAGDTNTKLFHLKATARRHHNFIPSFLHTGRSSITHEAKSEALHDFYSQHFGKHDPKATNTELGNLASTKT
jgi:hypothetical protein